MATPMVAAVAGGCGQRSEPPVRPLDRGKLRARPVGQIARRLVEHVLNAVLRHVVRQQIFARSRPDGERRRGDGEEPCLQVGVRRVEREDDPVLVRKQRERHPHRLRQPVGEDERTGGERHPEHWVVLRATRPPEEEDLRLAHQARRLRVVRDGADANAAHARLGLEVAHFRLHPLAEGVAAVRARDGVRPRVMRPLHVVHAARRVGQRVDVPALREAFAEAGVLRPAQPLQLEVGRQSRDVKAVRVKLARRRVVEHYHRHVEWRWCRLESPRLAICRQCHPQDDVGRLRRGDAHGVRVKPHALLDETGGDRASGPTLAAVPDVDAQLRAVPAAAAA
eukprot:5129720-Prymnesium_polylepis.1